MLASRGRSGTMKVPSLTNLSVEEILAIYVDAGVKRHDAIMVDKIGTFNRLCDILIAVEAELKGRPGDQRTAFLTLFDHSNWQVKLNAARAAAAVAPDHARQML
ncbi:DUF2019 domain-containing protein [Mangrovibrevibacter kandeliae]|uniref:DUF2019 domain-containing protein n=1 Tax=Mangrovibrevibacter kandeliae TaxID=2968473 RepID=UPI0021198100|nr:DUF2019 domain-containing protein [Aurantimonas sp. CSK15Z-1]MCQ8783340.1 DUF2019 domain-containing protein [Aurantimonas sp. CSK15Z-1]